MLHVENPRVRELLLKGNIGLEKESLRIKTDGHFAHTRHPFPDDKNIVRDFSENQTEINTTVFKSAKEAIASLDEHYRRIQKTLREMPQREYLWPFSNPPYIINEEDIPVAQYSGEHVGKTKYREYLSDRYGRYKMTFSGIHYNYSFDDELLKEDFKLSGESDFMEYKNQLYMKLAKGAAAYGWIIVAVTAASPIMDGSYVEKKKYNYDTFVGMASVRCSELGYWNFFAPTFDYSDIKKYVDGIQKYVDDGWIKYPSELYYPIRLKPEGENTLDALRNNGVNHIELRMFDLNPLSPSGIDERDAVFAQLFLVWLVSTKDEPFSSKNQIQAVQNFKNAAHFDLKTVKIVEPDGDVNSVADAALNIIGNIKEFYVDIAAKSSWDDEEKRQIFDVLKFEEDKFIDQQNRYAWKVKQMYEGGFVKKGLELARLRQEDAV